MSEPQRWTLEPYPNSANWPRVRNDRDNPRVPVPIEVMPVSEHEAILAAAREVMSSDEAELARLRRAIAEHRTAIHNAGPVRVDSRDVPLADAKQRADECLWAALDRGAPLS